MRTIPPPAVDVQDLEQYGYRQRFPRSLKSFDSFAIGFSFISITTSAFTLFGFVLTTAGPAGIWTYLIAGTGQTLVALVCAALAVRFPLAGASYQWGARLVNPIVGWWLGWLWLTYLILAILAVDYAFVQAAFQPLFGLTYSPASAAVQTAVVVAVQAGLIVWSTRATTRVNNAAVLFEIVGIAELVIVLLSAAFLAGHGHWDNLFSTGTLPREGWFGWLGPFMLATLLGGYNLVGFESVANLAEETEDPRRVVPRGMLRAMIGSAVLGFIFLATLAITVGDVKATTANPAPVAFILENVLGSAIVKIFLAFICVSIFCCGLVCMVTGSRLAWAMARDGRLPGHQLIARVPSATRGPTWATMLVAVACVLLVLSLAGNPQALLNLVAASTLLPAILYTGIVLTYVVSARELALEPGLFHLGRWEKPVIAGALLWLAYEFVIMLGPAQFRTAQAYNAGVIVLGLVAFALTWLLNPEVMRSSRADHETLPTRRL